MRTFTYPYNGNQYVLNISTGEIHDLDNETRNCKINEIKPEHVYNCISYESAQVHAVLIDNCSNPNGCFYCTPSKDNG